MKVGTFLFMFIPKHIAQHSTSTLFFVLGGIVKVEVWLVYESLGCSFIVDLSAHFLAATVH